MIQTDVSQRDADRAALTEIADSRATQLATLQLSVSASRSAHSSAADVYCVSVLDREIDNVNLYSTSMLKTSNALCALVEGEQTRF